MSSNAISPPSSILIIGTGVFGLSTAHALLTNARYQHTAITLLDAYVPPPTSHSSFAGSSLESSSNLLTASLDSSRIVRADYAKSAYSQLAREAQQFWRRGWPYDEGEDGECFHQPNDSPTNGAPKLYHTSSLLVTANHTNSNPRGSEYVASSLANVQRLQAQDDVNELPDRAAIRTALHSPNAAPPQHDDHVIGDFGYQNSYSSWADASGAMAGLRRRVRRLGEARYKNGAAGWQWKHGRAAKLQFGTTATGSSEVQGAVLDDGQVLSAQLTIVAAGAWSAALLPYSLSTRLRASGQPLAYIELSEDERKRLAGKPVLLNMGSALFSIPPPADAGPDEKPALKAAQHSWGYSRKVVVTNTEPREAKPSEEKQEQKTSDAKLSHLSGRPSEPLSNPPSPIEISIPPTDTTHPIPPRSADDLYTFLHGIYPEIVAGKTFTTTRLCWYSDTPSGDFLIAYVPAYGRSVLVASGGSGHGFKFAPVLGDWVVEVLERRWSNAAAAAAAAAVPTEGADKVDNADEGMDNVDNVEVDKVHDDLGTQLAQLWRWRSDDEIELEMQNPGDGSRGGERGLVWEDEMRGLEGWAPPSE